MSEPTATLDKSITDFAAAVRRHLYDLPLEDIDDLTDGLEADLSEQASDEQGDLHLDDPASYAEELRASAGLPPRASSTVPLRRRMRQRLDELEATTRRITRSTRLGSHLVDFALALRPVWWVLRGWVVYQLLTVVLLGRSALVPSDLIMWVLLFACIALSVQWGRGRWAPGSFLRVLRTVVSVVAIVALPFVMGWTVGQARANDGSSYDVAYPDPTELWFDGERVTNIFGYDAEGNPVTNIQLFDQDGDPLVTIGSALVYEEFDDGAGGTTVPVPYASSSRGYIWNVYPLREAPLGDMGDVDARDAQPATPPFRTTNAVPEPAVPTPSPTAAPTPTPTPPPVGEPAPSAVPDAAP
ncbi:hypothetical protein SCB71_04930 [Herbiconiux sp. KACC 21604]|uniref:hypothetical protein n=1 Tax=unclassified Herbiconiux TaxID=2618217 RepID=UPI001492D565|nr:hypothetical protein [Herbiconiux sp. SALV-R1]QJU52694.1 hypothetical protein HL652_02910 [Herbiconiux sp. SALV-R1]WPO87592.1 hypothetical protein SCB71_04930 [Herbiconiux sp. KACC 21604]